MTHVFEGDDVGVLPVSQQDLHLLRRVSLGLVDNLSQRQRFEYKVFLLQVF